MVPSGCTRRGTGGERRERETERPAAAERTAARDARLNLRASTRQQQLIRSAAAAVNKSVTDFVLDSATANAERVLADRRWFVLSEAGWSELEALLDAPIGATPKLDALLSEATVFDPPTS